eukprot:CAMPEP_0179332902 /NCGR_PEP_ID=MMETSP0797-20121207/65001_1 /TAXON_ID=47934 /ORGANISM="Dinophysis acuminata, Strain DAEP01" /LENGTH=96 /DNA_ID=CAMNT_0021045841 /DNA_START=74 /DNA_END=362 /DNA_ORIENTATION=+
MQDLCQPRPRSQAAVAADRGPGHSERPVGVRGAVAPGVRADTLGVRLLVGRGITGAEVVVTPCALQPMRARREDLVDERFREGVRLGALRVAPLAE